jgi:hypothetical protein
MNVKESDARRMLVAVGFNAETLKKVSKIQKNLSTLNAVAGTLTEPEDKADAKIRDEVLKALEANEEIVVDADPAEANGVAQVGSNGKAEKKRESKASSGERKGTDRFGSRIGSHFANANAVVSAKPKTMAEIVTESGIPATCYNHINKLVAAGFLVKTEDGKYRTKPRE